MKGSTRLQFHVTRAENGWILTYDDGRYEIFATSTLLLDTIKAMIYGSTRNKEL